MVRNFSWTLGVAVLRRRSPRHLPIVSSRTSARPARPQQPRPKFWQDPKLRQEIGITDKQSVDIETIFSSSISRCATRAGILETLEDVLSHTIQENTADLITVSQQVDKVEAARSAYNKARTLMLYRINRLLNPDQRVKVKALNDRYEEQRRKDEDARRKQG